MNWMGQKHPPQKNGHAINSLQDQSERNYSQFQQKRWVVSIKEEVKEGLILLT